MNKAIHRRRRRRPPTAVPELLPAVSSAPTGPAGGDLAGDYPNPQVIGLSHVTAGGDLSGSMDAPIVEDISHASVWPVQLPAVDGSLLTNIAPPAKLHSGVQTLLAGGTTFVTTGGASINIVVSWANSAGAGRLYATFLSTGHFEVDSSSGATDNGKAFMWIAF